MNVLVDGRPLVGNRTGVGVHTAEIAARLTPAPTIAAHAAIENRTGIEHCPFLIDPAALGVFWQQFQLPRSARSFDVLWGPHGTLPMSLQTPAVVTVHDFTSITMPGRHRLKTILSFNTFIGSSLERAHRVAAVSRSVADEAMRGFAVPSWKIELVPNGVDEFFGPADDDEGDYVLFVGTREPRKGIDDLLAVWPTLPSPRPRLVLCGDHGWKTDVKESAEIVVSGFADRAALRDLYRRAMIFVYPSRYEGFGIPPLEAMACGAPVIASRTGAIPEYSGNDAVLFPPGDRAALRDALVRMLGDRALRQELRRRGPERAMKYRWEPSAAKMSELLREAGSR